MKYFFKTQSSLEYLIIFGIAFFMIIILGGIFVSYSQGAKQTLNKGRITLIGNSIMNVITKVYFLGYGNKLSINTNFPNGISNMTIVHIINKTIKTGNTYKNISFDYLNITTNQNGLISSSIFSPNQIYIKFNCSSNCTENYSTNISEFNAFQFSYGPKTLSIQSFGNYVLINFVK